MATAPTDGLLVITNDLVTRVIQKNLAIYDKKGEQHYDIISAFIKSLRGSDPNAAVYWMARMLVAGEDPLFIARRMIILASEDIGNANPNALLLANNCFQAVHHIGMPEARIVLSQTAVYLACSPKSNASYMAIDEAIAWVKKTGDLPVPLHLRNAPTKLMKELGYHDGYKYAHEYAGNFADLEFLPESISGKKFYEPGNNARENELRRYLKNCWKDKYKYIILLLISLFSLRFCFAQDMHYSQFYQAPLELSPAQTGCYDGLFRFGANQKTQWLSVTKPYVHFSVYGDVPFFRDQAHRQQFSVGVNVNCDYTGDSRYNSVQPYVSLSYLKAIGRRSRHKLGLGMYFGFIQRSINYNAMTFDEQYVSNNVYLDHDTQQIIIITGPNMSGKSALLRQTALIVLMAQMGSYCPARQAHIGIVDKIFTRVGASDNISSGESTFMVEMNETASILNNISDRSLVLLDEIGRGTSTYDGISIAWAITEFLHNHKKARPKVMFATHYHELIEMADQYERIQNYHISVREVGNKVIFLRKLEMGGSEHSFGIHVARMAGMPPQVLKRADSMLALLESKSEKISELNPKAEKPSKKQKDTPEQGYQLSFIQLDDPTLLDIREKLLNIDIDTLTPIEALLKLNEIKKIVAKK